MIQKKLIAIGGGHLSQKTTNKIDEYVASLAKQHACDKRAVGVFIGTASHDSMPYFNSFRKTYTSDFNVKADCVLSVYGEMNDEKIRSKFEKADLIYIGGGDTLYMLDWWKKKGIYDYVLDAYNRGVVIAGLSAGAICWFEKMYTDSEFYTGGDAYAVYDGIGIIKGGCCPHYDVRSEEFDPKFNTLKVDTCWCIEGDAAIEFTNGEFTKALTSGGIPYKLQRSGSSFVKTNLLTDKSN